MKLMYFLHFHSEDLTVKVQGKNITMKGLQGYIVGKMSYVKDTDEWIFHFGGYAAFPGKTESIQYTDLPYYKSKNNFFKVYKNILTSICDQYPCVDFRYVGLDYNSELDSEKEAEYMHDFLKMLREVAETYNLEMKVNDDSYFKSYATHLYSRTRSSGSV